MANLVNKRSWDKTVRLDGDAPKIKPGNVIHDALVGKTIRDIRNGDFENMGNIQKVAGLFNVSEEAGPVKIGEISVTTLKDDDGKLHTVRGDAALVKTFISGGMAVSSVTTEDVMDG